MKAAILRATKAPMQIEDVAVADPAPREVLVRMVAAGVCHSDLHIAEGDLPHPLPAILGHEAAGVVERVGSQVSAVRPGDHVIISLTFPCGHCDQCDGGHGNRCANPDAMRGQEQPPRLSIGQAIGLHGWQRAEGVCQPLLAGALQLADDPVAHAAVRQTLITPSSRDCILR